MKHWIKRIKTYTDWNESFTTYTTYWSFEDKQRDYVGDGGIVCDDKNEPITRPYNWRPDKIVLHVEKVDFKKEDN